MTAKAPRASPRARCARCTARPAARSTPPPPAAPSWTSPPSCSPSRGYAGTSLDEIVAGARVTKGALYHHFSGKQALFESVFEKVEERAARDIHRAVRGNRDPWEKALGGLRAFLEVLQEPRYRRIVIADGPAVLGYERYREQEERTTFGIVQEIVSSVLASYELEPSMVETFSRVFFGAMSAAGAAVSTAEDPRKAGAEVEAAIGYILAGLRLHGRVRRAAPPARRPAPDRGSDRP